jgi:pimeloyl-ACP methyl ester carboxylesterase
VKTFINNRDKNDIAVVIEGSEHLGKLMFIAHGLSGNKEEPHIRAMIDAFLELDYVVVSYDAIHTFGESKSGEFEDATVTNYLADLEDVIIWASSKDWYVEPFVLCGHSLGSIAAALYTQKNPLKVKGLAPISTVISGKLSMTTTKYANDAERWKQEGIRITKKSDGSEMRLKWAHMEDRLKYDLLDAAGKLTMPVIMVVGTVDDSTPLVHQRLLFNKLPGQKELHTIRGADHTFDKLGERVQLKAFIKNWANNL